METREVGRMGRTEGHGEMREGGKWEEEWRMTDAEKKKSDGGRGCGTRSTQQIKTHC